jgi:hypothetical protein
VSEGSGFMKRRIFSQALVKSLRFNKQPFHSPSSTKDFTAAKYIIIGVCCAYV